MATAAAATALLVPAAHAQVPSVELPALPEASTIPENPPAAAISQQYHDVQAVVREALPAASAQTPVAARSTARAPKADPEPEYHRAAQQYHSETPPDVSVTQTQPENVNVSIRINSPGNDGPVTQINGAGGDIVSVVQPPAQGPGGPAPAAPPSGGLPDNWTWIWTSACFGGGGGGAQTASAGPSWNWQWSCAEDDPIGGLPLPDPDTPLMPSEVADTQLMPSEVAAGDLVPSAADVLPAALAGTPSAGVKAHRQRAKRPDGSPRRDRGSPPPAASPPSPALLAAAPRAAPAPPGASAPPVRARRAARHAPQARAAVNPDFPPGASGPSAGAATGLGAAISLLLGAWIAVLVCALTLVVPRMRRRRWSGPPWRLPPPRPARLERPG